MLSSFFSLDQKDIIHPKLFRTINGTFVLELLTLLLKISKSDITEECFAGMNAGSQYGKILTVIGSFDPLPIDRQVF